MSISSEAMKKLATALKVARDENSTSVYSSQSRFSRDRKEGVVAQKKPKTESEKIKMCAERGITYYPPDVRARMKADKQVAQKVNTKIHEDQKIHDIVRKHSLNATKLIARIKEIGGAKALQSDWFMVDKKTVDVKDVKTLSMDDRELSLLKDELKNIRDSVRSLTGSKPFKIRLYQLYSTNVNSSGILDVVTTVDPSTITEFISAAALYDEYKVTEFEYDFVFQNYMGTTGTGPITNGATFAYDPSDSVLLGASGAGLQAGRQLQQHKAYMTPGLTGNSTYRVAHDLFRFHAKMPPGVLQNISPSTATATTNWQPTLGSSYMPYGWFKQYAATFSNPSQACTSGMLTYWVEFRCRS